MNSKTKSILPLLLSLSTSVFAGCGGGTDPILEGRHHLRIDVHAEHQDELECLNEGPKVGMRWGLVADLTVSEGKVKGFLAAVESQSAQGDPVSFTRGNVAVEGTASGSTITLSPVEVTVPSGEPLQLDTLELTLSEGGQVEGAASGLWTWGIYDHRCDLPFDAVVDGSPDVAAPGAIFAHSDVLPHLPFEPIEVLLTEPVAIEGLGVTVDAEGSAVEATVTPIADAREGFAKGLQIVPLTVWPEGATVALTLTSLEDAAGNAADASIGSRAVQAAPPSDQNLGFESGMSSWITDPLPPENPNSIPLVRSVPELEHWDKNSESFMITPAEGGFMGLLSENTRLIGHLSPPDGATKLKLSIAVLDSEIAALLADRGGFSIELVSGGERSVVADGGDLPVPSDPVATWSGFGQVTIDLPESAAEGAWIIVQPTGFAPPIHVPVVLIDALSFE